MSDPQRDTVRVFIKCLFVVLSVLQVRLAVGAEIPRQAICRVRAQLSDGSFALGSGTLIDRRHNSERGTDDGLVLTCAHVLRGVPSSSAVEVEFVGDLRHKAKIVKIDSDLDLAALAIANTQVPGARVCLCGDVATTLTACGYGGDGQLRCFSGKRGKTFGAESGNQRSVAFRNLVRSGDSGGGVFNERGELVSVVWGAERELGNFSVSNVQLSQFLRPLGITGNCSGGVCRPPPMPSSPGRPVVLPQPPQPAPRPTSKCNCKEKFSLIEQRLGVIESQPPAKGMPGPPGQPGPAGLQGVPGTIGPPWLDADENAIVNVLLPLVMAQLNIENQPAVSHYVLIADDAADYWPRLSGEFTTAQQSYSQIRHSPVPAFPVGSLPQLVAYREGKPLGAFRGLHDVSIALANLGRGEVPQLED